MKKLLLVSLLATVFTATHSHALVKINCADSRCTSCSVMAEVGASRGECTINGKHYTIKGKECADISKYIVDTSSLKPGKGDKSGSGKWIKCK